MQSNATTKTEIYTIDENLQLIISKTEYTDRIRCDISLYGPDDKCDLLHRYLPVLFALIPNDKEDELALLEQEITKFFDADFCRRIWRDCGD